MISAGFKMKKINLFQFHEISFGKLDPPKVSGGYHLPNDSYYVPRINSDLKIQGGALFQISGKRAIRVTPP